MLKEELNLKSMFEDEFDFVEIVVERIEYHHQLIEALIVSFQLWNEIFVVFLISFDILMNESFEH